MKTEKIPKSERQAALVQWVKEHEVVLVKQNCGPVAARKMLKAQGIDPKGLSFRKAIRDADCRLWHGRKVRESTATHLTWKQWERLQSSIRKYAPLLVGDFSDIGGAVHLLGQQGVRLVSRSTVQNAASSMGWLGEGGRIVPPANAANL